MFDPARMCIALAPLAVYLLVMGAINLSRRPFVTTGARDLLTLGVGLSGLVIVGPIELLTSTPMVLRLGPAYWLLVVGLYGSCWLLIALQLKPRLVVYNISEERLRAALTEVSRGLDAEAHWAGDSLVLPAVPTQLLIEPFAALRNVSVVAVGETHPLALWRYLEAGLRRQFAGMHVTRNGHGLMFVVAGLLMVAAMVTRWVQQPEELTRGLWQMLGVG